ncbi:MAG: hypothetical protein ABSC77_12620 [Terracidiphilus sp.]
MITNDLLEKAAKPDFSSVQRSRNESAKPIKRIKRGFCRFCPDYTQDSGDLLLALNGARYVIWGHELQYPGGLAENLPGLLNHFSGFEPLPGASASWGNQHAVKKSKFEVPGS